MNKSYGIGFIFLLMVSISCFRDPDFPATPTITYKSIALKPGSIEVKLNFTDGDGDLGLSENDLLSPPFDSIKVYDSLLKERIETNINRINYDFTFLFRNVNGDFKTCSDSLESCSELLGRRLNLFKGHFEDYNPDRKKRPISGELTFNIISPLIATELQGKTIKLKIFIKDRALNNSNTIETDTLLIR